jgi:membrane associated rhomboid family serine protease
VRQTSEPIFNLPPVIVGTVVALAVVHAVRVLMLSPQAESDFLLQFAFIPERYDPHLLTGSGFSGADIWTFFTYALIHADLFHLGMNVIWLLPFGSALARRFGTVRFLLFCAVTAAAGAATHLATHIGEVYPLVGASAAISGTMAASMRFAFQHGGPLARWYRHHDEEVYRLPADSLVASLREPRVLIFTAVWFGINVIFGLGGLNLESGQTIAWQAHIGGYIAGMVLFPLFDPIPSRSFTEEA